jgi:hypothetical protein
MSITTLLSNISKPVQLGDVGNTTKKQLQQLSQDLKTGDLAAAQKDYATVQQDLKKAVGKPEPNQLIHPHHHFGGGSSSSQTSLLQEINQLGQSLATNDLSGAQQAYSTLQQQLQQTSLGSQSSSNSSVSMDA